jgi:hypothetical protein
MKIAMKMSGSLTEESVPTSAGRGNSSGSIRLAWLEGGVDECLMNLRDTNFIRAIDDAKRIKQPNHHTDHHDDIQDFLDLAVHGNVGVDEPEQNSHHNQSYNDSYKGHRLERFRQSRQTMAAGFAEEG